MNQVQRSNLLLFTLGRLVSLTGSGIQSIALPLFILDKTGSGTMMGVFAMLSIVPTLVVAPFAGVLGDRLNRKTIAVYTDFGRGAIILLLAWLAFTGRINIAALFVCQVFVSILDSLFGAATSAMLPDLVDPESYSRANSFRNGADSLSMILGPMLGGIIYGLWGVQTVFLINALSFLFSALCEWLIAYRPIARKDARLTLKSTFGDLDEILSFIWRQVGLKQLVLFALFVNFLTSPTFSVGMPFVLKKVIGFSSEQYGYLMTTYMGGALLGNVLLGVFLARAGLGRIMKGGLLAQGLLIVGLACAFFPSMVQFLHGPGWILFGVIAAAFVLIGFFNAFFNTPLQTNLQKMVPAGMRARLFAVLGLVAQLAVPVGSMVYGFSLDRMAPHLFVLGVAVFGLGVTVFFLKAASPEVFEPGTAAGSGNPGSGVSETG